jgi:tetratricopeptide (TPR) repeat protein
VESNRDNLRLQKLFSDVCLELGKKEEALETLKYLLFINPRDKNIAELVLRIEKEVDDKYKPQHRPISIPAEELTTEIEASPKPGLFDLDKLNNSTSATKSDFDDWITYDLNLESKSVNTSTSSSSTQFTNHDHWSVIKGDEGHAIPITKDEDNKNEEEEEEIRSYHVHLDVATEISSEEKAYVEDRTPMVTHTLVDLYCGQGHIEKALDVLEKILLLNPKDQKTISKIKEIQALSPPVEELEEAEKVHDELMKKTESSINDPIEDVTEEEGRRYLMSLIDEKLGPIEIVEKDIVNQRAKLIEEKLSVFLKKIQKRALDYQCRV